MAAGSKQDIDLVVGGEKLLGVAGRFEPPHDTLPPSGGFVRNLGRIVQALVAAMCKTRNQLTSCSAVGAQFIRDHHPGHAVLFHQFAHEAFRSFCIAPALDQDIKSISVVIHGPPQPMLFAADRNHHLVQVPFVANRRAVTSDRSGILATELSYPKPDGFMADHDPAFG